MKKFLLIFCVFSIFTTTVDAKSLSDWAKKDYEEASISGLISGEVVKNDLKGNITREEFCDLAINLYRSINQNEPKKPEKSPFEDCSDKEVIQCYELGIVSGKSETEFKPNDEITRQEMAKLIVNTIVASNAKLVIIKDDADSLIGKFADGDQVAKWAYAEVALLLKNSIISGVSESDLAPLKSITREQAIAIVNRAYNKYHRMMEINPLPEIILPEGEVYAGKESGMTISACDNVSEYYLIAKSVADDEIKTVKITSPRKSVDLSSLEYGKEYSIILGIKFLSGVETFSAPVHITPAESKAEEILPEEPEVEDDEEKIPTIVPDSQLALTEKEKRVFPDGVYFQTKEEAEEYMTEITVNVWNFNYSDELVKTTRELVVNVNLAEDVKNIFQEIFEAEVPFPIKSVGGFSWRNSAMGKISQHSYGTCIDINPDENYYCYTSDGSAIVGEGWFPGENPYSITPDGIVVKTFEKYGWVWGGSWDGSVKDYMHFSYLGK